jgi:hypothetical protein
MVLLACGVLFAVQSIATGSSRAGAVTTPQWFPVINGDFADPSIMVYGGVEYAYSTNYFVFDTPWATSSNSTTWTSGPTDALPTLPGWASFGATWAPSVEPNAAGQFVMWYSAHDTATGTECISRAVASSPTGPFADSGSAPIICQPTIGSIDPDIFTAPSGQHYLYWKSDGDSAGQPSILWVAPLDNSLNLTGPGTVVLRADQTWQDTIIEGPDMTYADGTYYLFYSSNAYQSAFDAIGYATCTGPLGPCQDSLNNPVLVSSTGMTGPGGPSVFTAPNGRLLMAFDAWPAAVGYNNGGYRALFLAGLSFGSSGQPIFVPVNPPNSVPVGRIDGVDAIGTAIAVSQTEFATGSAKAVVLARSDFFSDALAGGPLAAAEDGPLLITPGAGTAGSLDPRVVGEIQRVLPSGGTVYILGGPLALSPGIDAQLQSMGYVTKRLSGADEFATAVAIANQLGNPSTVFEATGLNFFDALSAVPAAIETHGAILLTDGDIQAPETAAYLAQFVPSTRYAIGGPLAAAGADPAAHAIFGADLFGTSAAVATTFFPNALDFGAATAASFPDALSGGTYMGTGGRNGPVLLVDPNAPLPASIDGYLASNAGHFSRGTVFGGPLAVTDAVLVALELAG